jgi:hypothetical protein
MNKRFSYYRAGSKRKMPPSRTSLSRWKNSTSCSRTPRMSLNSIVRRVIKKIFWKANWWMNFESKSNTSTQRWKPLNII